MPFEWKVSEASLSSGLLVVCLYGSILPGREFGAYLCPYFVGENSPPVRASKSGINVRDPISGPKCPDNLFGEKSTPVSL